MSLEIIKENNDIVNKNNDDELQKVTNEIKKTIIENLIKVGNLLIQAKQLVPSSDWKNYLSDEFNFGERTAQKYMKVAKEMSANPDSFFRKIGKTKTFSLLDINKNERQKFIENNDIENMTTKELKRKIVEYNNKKSKKICERCNKELDVLDFYEGHSICKECENKIEEERINKNRQKNKDKEDEEFNEILKDIKTPKDITKSSIDSNISCIKETSDDFIENLNSTLFVMEKLIDKINKDNVNILLDLLEEHISKIKDIENQINEKVGKSEYDSDDKEILKKFYKDLVNKYYSDNNEDITKEMQLLNKIKKDWGI